MKRLLRAMWYALLTLIAVIVTPATIRGIVCGLEALGLDKGTSVVLAVFIFAYMIGVFVFYKMDK